MNVDIIHEIIGIAFLSHLNAPDLKICIRALDCYLETTCFSVLPFSLFSCNWDKNKGVGKLLNNKRCF